MPTDQRLKLKEMSVQGRQLWLFQVTWCLEFTSWDTCLRPKRLSFLFRVGWVWAKKKKIILELLLLITFHLPQDCCDYILNMVKSWMEFLLVQPVYKAELQSVNLVQTRWWLLSLSSESFQIQGNGHKYINQNHDVKYRCDLGLRWEPRSRC